MLVLFIKKNAAELRLYKGNENTLTRIEFEICTHDDVCLVSENDLIIIKFADDSTLELKAVSDGETNYDSLWGYVTKAYYATDNVNEDLLENLKNKDSSVVRVYSSCGYINYVVKPGAAKTIKKNCC